MRGLLVAVVLLVSVARVHAEPDDGRYFRQELSSQVITNGVATGTIVGSRSPTCINSATRGRLTCDCELSLKLFGKIIPDLRLAWTWRKMFAATQAGNG